MFAKPDSGRIRVGGVLFPKNKARSKGAGEENRGDRGLLREKGKPNKILKALVPVARRLGGSRVGNEVRDLKSPVFPGWGNRGAPPDRGGPTGLAEKWPCFPRLDAERGFIKWGTGRGDLGRKGRFRGRARGPPDGPAPPSLLLEKHTSGLSQACFAVGLKRSVFWRGGRKSVKNKRRWAIGPVG